MADTAIDCSCAQYRTHRRAFLKGLGLTAGASVITSGGDGVFRQIAFADDIPGAAADAASNNVLVVLSLRGGADGLSMVVPYGDPDYYDARPRIALPAGSLIAKDGFFGLHPSFAPLMPMWNQGKMAAIQAVGLPAPNRSHFAATEEVEEADPGSSTRVGWLNRMIGLDVSTKPTDAVEMGSAMIPTSLYGPEPVLGLTTTSDAVLPGAGDGPPAAWKRASLTTLYQHDSSPLGLAGMAALDACSVMSGLVAKQPPPAPGASYPGTPFSDVMQDTARLLKAGLGVKVVTVDFGSWDMHVNLGDLTSGAMKPMLDELAQTIAAFFTDLGPLRDNVTMVTISEFGRRVAENANAGLDHGYGNVMLALGGGVVGGRVYGSWPGLDSSDLNEGDLSVTRDYRSVLTEVLRSRTTTSTSQVFPGFVADRTLGFMA